MEKKKNDQLTLAWPQESDWCDETDFWGQMNGILASFPVVTAEVLPGLKWGYHYQLYTPAFWKLQYLLNDFPVQESNHQLCDNLIEEIIMCLLGGYGIPSEMGIMAFDRLKQEGLISRKADHDSILDALSRPFVGKSNKPVRYRFANQKAGYIYHFLNREDLCDIPSHNDLALRKWLMGLRGIGPKTASWITRNWLHSERVAILDIHILRAGILTGFFAKELNVSNDYYHLEYQYLNFCKGIEVLPSNMDAIIWSYMKKNNKLALNILSSTS